MPNPKLAVPNLTRIRATQDTSVADAFETIKNYVNKNTTPSAGTRRAAPTAASHPIIPKTP